MASKRLVRRDNTVPAATTCVATQTPCVVAKGLPDEETECSRAEGCGSINEVGWRFQPFGINDLEMVAQIFTGWNRMTDWLGRVAALQRGA